MTTRSGFLFVAVFAVSLIQADSLRLIGRSPLNSQIEQRSDSDDNRQGFIWNIYRRFAGSTDSPVQQNNIKDIQPEEIVDANDNDGANDDSDIDKDYENEDKPAHVTEEVKTSTTTTTTTTPAPISYSAPYYPYASQSVSNPQLVYSSPIYEYYPPSSYPNAYAQPAYQPIYGDYYSNPQPASPPSPPLPLPPLINITYSPILAPATNTSNESSSSSVTDPIMSSNVRAELADLVIKSLSQNSNIQAVFNPIQSYQDQNLKSPASVQNESPSKLHKTNKSGPLVISSNGGSYDLSHYHQEQARPQQYYVAIPLSLLQNNEEAPEQQYYAPSRNSYKLKKNQKSKVRASRPIKVRNQKRRYSYPRSGGKMRKPSSQRRRKRLNKINTSSASDDLVYITIDDDANPISNGNDFVNDVVNYY